MLLAGERWATTGLMKNMAEQARGQNGGPERKLQQDEAASEAVGVTVWCGARVCFGSCEYLASPQQPAPF